MQTAAPPPLIPVSLNERTSVTSSSSPAPSRFALYRVRQRCGEPVRQHRSPLELAAIASKPTEERSAAEKKALRNQRAYARRKEKKALLAEVEADPVRAPALGLDSSAATAGAAAAAAAATSAEPATLSDPGLSPRASSPPSFAYPASAVLAGAPWAPSTPAAASSASLSVPLLLQSALRFLSTLPNKQQRCLPFTFDSAHRAALEAAVERRVLQDVAHGTSASVAAASAPSSAQRLCASDVQLLQSCLTVLQRWPCWMQQQWRAMTTRKIAKSEVRSTRSCIPFCKGNYSRRAYLNVAVLLLCEPRSHSSTNKQPCTTSFGMWPFDTTLRLDLRSDQGRKRQCIRQANRHC
jgi:hypothetical protein